MKRPVSARIEPPTPEWIEEFGRMMRRTRDAVADYAAHGAQRQRLRAILGDEAFEQVADTVRTARLRRLSAQRYEIAGEFAKAGVKSSDLTDALSTADRVLSEYGGDPVAVVRFVAHLAVWDVPWNAIPGIAGSAAQALR